MYNKIKQAVIKALIGDSTNYPKAGASYKGKDTDVIRQSVYGVCSQPPVGSLGILFQVCNSNGTQYGIFDYVTGRFKNLEAGEVQLGNYLTQASIKFDKDGNVTVNVPAGNLTANVSGNLSAAIDGNTTLTTTDLNITATGTSTINGGLTVTGDIIANNFDSSGIGVDFNTHIHTGDSGGSTSGPI